MNYETFGQIENEIEQRVADLRALDKSYAEGELYPQCPRCEGDRTINVITRWNGEYIAPDTEHVSCPLCGGTGEADIESAEEWLLNILDMEELSDEDEKYLETRKKIA